MLLNNRTALITGGAMGIGRGIALRFADEGCSIAVCDINMKDAEETVNEAKTRGAPKAIAISCDVTSAAQVKDAVDKALIELGGIDILVNNVGGMVFPSPNLEDITEGEWDRILSLNLKSSFLFCKNILPHMKNKKYGKIIGLSSLGAVSPPAHASHYNAAKAGVLGLCKDLARELAPYNICVNAILPGPVRTSFYEAVTGSMSQEEVDGFFEGLGKRDVPMGRVGTPEEIGNVAVFFASELSSFVTGQELAVGGGLPLTPQN